MELKLTQELESVYQDPLFLVFRDIRKSCNNLDCGTLLQTLSGYREGPKIQGPLLEFWSRQEVLTRQNGFHSPQFQSTQGTI